MYARGGNGDSMGKPRGPMSKYKKIAATYLTKEDKKSLESLVRRYLEKTDELESKENKVLKQMEVMQSAVTSLQGWNRRRMSQITNESVSINAAEVEEETRKIREETARIQREIRAKIEDNKKLQDAVNRRKQIQTLQKEAGREREEVTSGETTPVEYTEVVNRERERKKMLQKIEDGNVLQGPSDSHPSGPLYVVASGYEDDDDSIPEDDAHAKDPRVRFFQEKIRKLKEMERRLMKESEEDARVSKAQRQKLMEKIEMLEWEAEIDRQMIKSLKRKYQSAPGEK